jgi:hypothetical protein
MSSVKEEISPIHRKNTEFQDSTFQAVIQMGERKRSRVGDRRASNQCEKEFSHLAEGNSI